MKKLNYEFLTTFENIAVNDLYSHYCKLVKNGLITIKEAEFCYVKKLLKEYPEKAFNIYTNCPNFLESGVK